MKCSNCGSEWHSGQDSTNTHYCPFCGTSLSRKELPAENLTLPTVLKQIIERFGPQIFLDTQKCIAVFKDIAPTLKEEQKILEMALKLDVGTYFAKAQENEKEAAIKKSVSAMEGILADDAIVAILSAFVTALNWDALLLDNTLATKHVSYQTLNANTSQFQNGLDENLTEKTSSNKNSREEKIKAITEVTLQKADVLMQRADVLMQKADVVKETAYVAAGVAGNLATAAFKKASEKLAETTERSNQAAPKIKDTWQPTESETISQMVTNAPEGTLIDSDEASTNKFSQETSYSVTNQSIGDYENNSPGVSQNISDTSTVNSNVLPSPQSLSSATPNNTQPQKGTNKMKIGLIAAAVLVLGGFGFFSLSNNSQNNYKSFRPETTYKAQVKQPIAQQPKPLVTSQKSNLDLTKEYLLSLGYKREAPYIKATTYGCSTDGFLFYQFKFIWIMDTKRNRMACLLNTSEVIGDYKLYKNKNINRPLYLKLAIGQDERDKDANLGVWDDKQTHIIPIYVLYDFNPDGTMNDKGIYSGGGENPSHYHSYLYEQKNVDMVNIFLKQLAYFDQTVFNDFPMATDTSTNQPTTNTSSATVTSNSTEARNTFINFHKAITDKRLGDAYNTLSPNYQKFMRSYDNFARGYATTLRSDVVDLNTIQEDSSTASYIYKLKAVDREGSGTKTQYFSGKVKLIKINGSWRIDSTEAKRL